MMIHTQQENSNLSGGQQTPPGSDSSLSRAAHTSVAVALGFILVLGVLGNFLLLLVFSRYPGLRTPANLLLVNISVSDMLVCLFGTPLSFAASVRGRWLTGSYGCRWYGFSNALFGVVSLVSLSLLSFERYAVLLSGSQLSSSHYRRARLSVAFSWLYSLAWTLPPLLGWSSYGPEGPGTVCSVQWRCRSVTARSYIICLFVFCLLLPLLLMFFCYGRILLAVRGVTRQAAGFNKSQAEGRIFLMVVAMVTGYLLCWTPYGVVAMLASFGRPGAVPPAAALIPALLAKTSTVLNPVICVLLNNQFSRCFLDMISCSSEDSSADVLSSRSIWAQKMPTEEPNTDPALLPSTDHNVQIPASHFSLSGSQRCCVVKAPQEGAMDRRNKYDAV
ncbi:pinopsin-like isoform X2 [Poecilia reticulata]|uniref:pinopsin-like isoform X2 n=1 Tax=Poecilia reticulata TaxID=8081 RepID=UPI0004A4BB13|nr:PREDICTED: pinopsin-like isoform X2 [Poecilia reticulata]